MIVFELRNTNLSGDSILSRSGVGLFATVAGAQAHAEKKLGEYLTFAIEEAADPDVLVTPMTTALCWEERVLPTRFPTGRGATPKATLTAQYDRYYGFTIVEVPVGP